MSKFSAKLDEDTADTFDRLAMLARRALGRRVDKQEILRAMIFLAADDAALRDQVFAQIPQIKPGRVG